jgi:hypothetical protein|tara:strand:- start:34 stop:414 length:381 start_codon:yes stop_codon:yes gene_type:complete
MPGLTNRRRAIQEGSDWTKGYSEGGSVKKYVKGGSVSEKEMEIWKRAAPSIKRKKSVGSGATSKREMELYKQAMGIGSGASDIAIRKAILKKIGETKGSVSEKEIALLKQATLKPAKKARKRSAKK